MGHHIMPGPPVGTLWTKVQGGTLSGKGSIESMLTVTFAPVDGTLLTVYPYTYAKSPGIWSIEQPRFVVSHRGLGYWEEMASYPGCLLLIVWAVLSSPTQLIERAWVPGNGQSFWKPLV